MNDHPAIAHHTEPDRLGLMATAHLLPISGYEEEGGGSIAAYVRASDLGCHWY